MTIALQVDQQRAEQLLGASDAAGVLGLDKYKPPIAIWRRLRGLDVESPAGEAAEWGVALEPVVRGKYALQTHSAVAVPESSITKDGWLRATPDGFVHKVAHSIDVRVFAGSFSKPDGLLEVKTCASWLRDEWIDGPPPRYEIQARVQMAVTDLPWCDVVCLIGGQRYVGPFRVNRDATLETRILTDLRKFWDLVQAGIEPAVDSSPAWADHVSGKMGGAKVELVADEDMRTLLGAWKRSRNERKLAEEVEREVKTAILLRMSAAGAASVIDGDLKVPAYKTGGRTDWKGYAMSLGGGNTPPGKFKKPSATWALRAPWGEDDE